MKSKIFKIVIPILVIVLGVLLYFVLDSYSVENFSSDRQRYLATRDGNFQFGFCASIIGMILFLFFHLSALKSLRQDEPWWICTLTWVIAYAIIIPSFYITLKSLGYSFPFLLNPVYQLILIILLFKKSNRPSNFKKENRKIYFISLFFYVQFMLIMMGYALSSMNA